jgi:hypothetical protein
MIFPATQGDIEPGYLASRRGTDPAKRNRSPIVSPKYMAREAMSLNGETAELLIDEEYIGYHRDRPAPE